MRSISIVAVTLIFGIAGLWLHAQGRQAPAPAQQPPQIISGADFGFRVDGVGPDGTISGKIVVRQKGQWVEVGLSGGIRRLNAN